MFIGLKKFLILFSLSVLVVACASGSQGAGPTTTDSVSAEASDSQEATATTSAPAPEALFSAETLADGQPIAASFEGTGSADLQRDERVRRADAIRYNSGHVRDIAATLQA